MHTVRSKETQRDFLNRIIPCVIKCKVGSIIEHKGAFTGFQSRHCNGLFCSWRNKKKIIPHHTCIHVMEYA